MTRMRSDSERISSSSSETSRIARPSSRSVDEPPVQELDRTDVEAARRLRGDQHARVARDLARDDELLLVAAGERRAPARRARRRARRTRAMQAPGGRDHPARAQPAELRGGLVPVVVQREVLGERELEHDAAPQAVLGNVAHAGVDPVARAPSCVMSVPASCTWPALALRSPVSASIELGLAVSVDARDADDLAGAHREADAAHRREAAVVDAVEVLDLEQRLARARRRLVDAQQDLAPHHQPREPCSVAPSRGTVSTSLPRRSTLIRSAISSTSCSLWLMKITDMPSRISVREDLEEVDRLLRRQHGRRLVEDEDVGVAGRAP